MRVFGFTESLVSYFEGVSILEEDFSLRLGSLHVIIFFLIVWNRLQDCKRERRVKESECH